MRRSRPYVTARLAAHSDLSCASSSSSSGSRQVRLANDLVSDSWGRVVESTKQDADLAAGDGSNQGEP